MPTYYCARIIPAPPAPCPLQPGPAPRRKNPEMSRANEARNGGCAKWNAAELDPAQPTPENGANNDAQCVTHAAANAETNKRQRGRIAHLLYAQTRLPLSGTRNAINGGERAISARQMEMDGIDGKLMEWAGNGKPDANNGRPAGAQCGQAGVKLWRQPAPGKTARPGGRQRGGRRRRPAARPAQRPANAIAPGEIILNLNNE